MGPAQRIIVIEDDDAMQDALRVIFERAGYAVTLLPNGNSLLTAAYPLPDLFILDKQLSGVDGLDVCRYLKQEEVSRQIPVIMLSATNNIAGPALGAGADAFLEKPFRMQELLDLVAKCLG